MVQKLFIDDGGTGNMAIVFLHSMAGGTHHWQAQLEALRPEWRGIAVDLRGHHQSSGGDSFTLVEMAEDVLKTVDRLKIDRFILIGHSMGGAVAMKLSGLAPERLLGLLLADVAGDSTQIPADQREGLLAALASPGYQGVIEQYWSSILVGAAEANRSLLMNEIMKLPQSTVVAIFKELMQYNPLPDLARYDGPKLIISTPAAESPFALHVLRPDIPHIRMEGTSHWLQLDRPAEFNKHLKQFLSQY